jgi:hypothetical protein
LPSARQKALGKDVFAGIFTAECPLPGVTRGKAFTECFQSFAETTLGKGPEFSSDGAPNDNAKGKKMIVGDRQ